MRASVSIHRTRAVTIRLADLLEPLSAEVAAHRLEVVLVAVDGYPPAAAPAGQPCIARLIDRDRAVADIGPFATSVVIRRYSARAAAYVGNVKRRRSRLPSGLTGMMAADDRGVYGAYPPARPA